MESTTLATRHASSAPLRIYFGSKGREARLTLSPHRSPALSTSHICAQETQRGLTQRESGALFAAYNNGQ